MGAIEQEFLNHLRAGEEKIDFKTFTFDGEFIETREENILVKTPEKLTPINNDLIRFYEKPLKRAEIKTDIEGSKYVYNDGNFALGNTTTNDHEYWTVNGNLSSDGIISDSDQNVKALTAERYFKYTFDHNESSLNYVFLETKAGKHIFPKGVKGKITFSYYVEATSADNQYFLIDYIYSYNSSGARLTGYDQAGRSWDNQPSGITTRFTVENFYPAEINQWVTKTIEFDPHPFYLDLPNEDDERHFPYGTGENFIRLGFALGFKPATQTANFTAIYIDNIQFGKVDGDEFSKNESIRTQIDNNGTFTGSYDFESIYHNDSNSPSDRTNIYNIEGSFKRQRDTVGKSLEAITTQEQINDARSHVPKYEGTFRTLDDQLYPIGLHNKVFVDFGELLQEKTSAYIDGMTLDLKRAEIDLKLHLPNQDDDIDTLFVKKME
jgi:hypothetical protein